MNLRNHHPDVDRFRSVNLTDPNKPIYLCNPVCYFYFKGKKMMPVAIQLTAHEEDPIFTPNDGIFERVLQNILLHMNFNCQDLIQMIFVVIFNEINSRTPPRDWLAAKACVGNMMFTYCQIQC